MGKKQTVEKQKTKNMRNIQENQKLEKMGNINTKKWGKSRNKNNIKKKQNK